jgi:hypothetical protein
MRPLRAARDHADGPGPAINVLLSGVPNAVPAEPAEHCGVQLTVKPAAELAQSPPNRAASPRRKMFARALGIDFNRGALLKARSAGEPF